MNLDIRIFVNVVTTILDYFLDISKATKYDNQSHFDIDLTKEEDFCVIYVTNCGCGDGHFEDILLSFFNELNPRIEIHTYFKTITAFVRATNGEEWAYDLRYPENRTCQICMRRLDTKESQRFAHMEKYQSFTLRCTLLSKDIGIFAESLLENIKALANLHKSYLNAKYTFHCGEEMMYQNHVELTNTMVNCKLMSSAIMKIIVRSRNDEFRTRCFSLLDVSDSVETGDAVTSKLSSLVPDSREEENRDSKLSTVSNNDQAQKNVKIHEGKKRDNELSSEPNNDEAKTNGKANDRVNSVASPIIMSSRGRKVKKIKFYHDLYNA